MPTDFTSDADLHKRVQRRVALTRVSYSEALNIEAAQFETASISAALSSAQRKTGEPLSDAQAHAAALARVRSHGVSYAEAIGTVCAEFTQSSRGADFGETKATVDDARLHRAATAYSQAHAVSYSEALGKVADGLAAGTVNFREAPGDVGDLPGLEGRPIEVFKAGTHRDDSGTSRTFSVADMQATAKAYDRALHEAPLTVGHPKSNLPAYGWADRFEATDDGRLMMYARQVDPAFAEIVQAGRFKKRSSSFYAPSDPSNPVAGVWYPRHIAWLGAQPPAIKGLVDVQFADAGLGSLITFDSDAP